MDSSFTHPDLAVDSVLDALGAAGFAVGGRTTATRVVLDTFDGRLHRAGLRLEQRTGAVPELVLFGPTGAAVAHLDWARAAPRRAGDLPAGPLRERVASPSGERALLPLLTLTSRARVASKRDPCGAATVSVGIHDRLSVVGGSVGAPAWVAEVAPVAGHDDARAAVVSLLAALGLVAHDGDLATVVARAIGTSLEGHTTSPTIRLDRHQDALAAHRAVLVNLAATIDLHLPGTISGTDPGFLHELRVAVRRTRSVLSQAKGVLPGDVRARFRELFGHLGDVTSPARDLDVQLLGWDVMVGALDPTDPRVLARLRHEIEDRRAAAYATMARELAAPTCRDTLDDWLAWLVDHPVESRRPRPIGPVVARRIARAQAAVIAHGRAITPQSPPAALHELRKDAKKLRYLLECFGGLLESRPRKAFVGQLKLLQDNLGEHQDAEVQRAMLGALAHDLRERAEVDTDALLVIDRLRDLLDRRRQIERDAFVDRFSSYDTKANRAALTALLVG